MIIKSVVIVPKRITQHSVTDREFHFIVVWGRFLLNRDLEHESVYILDIRVRVKNTLYVFVTFPAVKSIACSNAFLVGKILNVHGSSDSTIKKFGLLQRNLLTSHFLLEFRRRRGLHQGLFASWPTFASLRSRSPDVAFRIHESREGIF